MIFLKVNYLTASYEFIALLRIAGIAKGPDVLNQIAAAFANGDDMVGSNYGLPVRRRQYVLPSALAHWAVVKLSDKSIPFPSRITAFRTFHPCSPALGEDMTITILTRREVVTFRTSSEAGDREEPPT
jgi:hypothetical protein